MRQYAIDRCPGREGWGQSRLEAKTRLVFRRSMEAANMLAF